MPPAMRRLQPRGRACRGVAVDAAGAMLGPDCVLVTRGREGYRSLGRSEAAAIQAAVLPAALAPNWLFEQSRRVAVALAIGEVALAQIHGLQIPIGELNGPALRRLAAIFGLRKANFDPDEPRIPAGEPGGGEWTDESGGGASADDGIGSGSGGPGNGSPSGSGGDQKQPEIPTERPATAKERNTIVRRTAEWLRRAAVFGAAFAPDPRIKAVLLAVEGATWLAEYWPEIRSYYLDGPKTLAELQDAVARPRPGYQRHHIVEGQYGSSDPLATAQRFGDRLESRDNLGQIPYWKHVEISSWYSTRSEEYGGLTPRQYMRGKSWEEQYDLGIRKLRDFGVLK